MAITRKLREFLGLNRWFGASRPATSRGPIDHVVILDGTMSTLEEGLETNAGITYKLLCELAPNRHVSLWYEAGIPWDGWRNSLNVIAGRGLNRRIRRAYGFIASRYRPGDRIFLMGYSRGAYAARSLAGMVDQIGLLKAEHATVRNIRQIYRLYQETPGGQAAQTFARLYCHEAVRIEMVGVWDTVKALGIRLPLLWRVSPMATEFHTHRLGPSIAHGYHALAMNETRMAFAPVLWETPADWEGTVEQMWFRGTHGDVGGHLSGFEAARPLSNIPLVWMLEKLEGCGMALPEGWRERFVQNPDAPSVGMWRGFGKLFLFRRRRVIGSNLTERIHPTAERFRKT